MPPDGGDCSHHLIAHNQLGPHAPPNRIEDHSGLYHLQHLNLRGHTQIQESIIFLGVLGVDNVDETVIWLPMVYIATNRIIYNGANKK